MAIVYIGGFKIFKVPSRFLQDSCQFPARFVPGLRVHQLLPLSPPHQSPRVGSLRCLCWGVWEVVVVVVVVEVCRVGSSSLALVQAQV